MPDIHSGLLPNTTIDKDEHSQVLHAKRVVDINNSPDTLFDYVSRTDDNPVYIGVGDGVITSDKTGWLIYKITWSDSPVTRPTRIQYTIGIYDDRASLFS